ncbi:formate/nitrite transporter family protein [Halosimplex rubrum]|uniref:Formate/nitrite transporter family protein n=1 Tax=Halosimplex rubrum TaxID=869889 RepID=A0A7D5NZX7_9EURY|nr:formate/nitrite transporter family protein [Halosimplex rubrum]QLH77197.1 formate/nitrite transporter family protein [Halosimplex rubrum]
MAEQLTPGEIFDRAVAEGERRLDQSPLELASTSFIAGFTVLFGVVALGIVEGLVRPTAGHAARVAGALAFAPGVVFLVAGRTELFNENFSDPAAAAVERGVSALPSLLRLWTLTFVFNLLGGGLLALVFAVDGAIPPAGADALQRFAEETAHRPARTWFTRGVAGGALVSLLSFLVVSVRSDGSRLWLAYAVGFMLALGPFDHVVVSILHVVLGTLLGATVGPERLAAMTAVVTAGNLVGGFGLVTVTHVTQAMGAESSDG